MLADQSPEGTNMLSPKTMRRWFASGRNADGSLFRLYWIPFMFAKDWSRRTAEARDAAGETSWRSVIPRTYRPDRQCCAHRGAPMMFGRNEDAAALRLSRLEI